MKTIITFLIFSACIFSSKAQSDSITLKKVMGGYLFYEGDNKMTLSQLSKTLKTNKIAHTEYKKGTSSYVITSILGLVGGGLIGWPLGSALGGGKPNWKLAGIGAGLVVIGIPFNTKFFKHTTTAVDLYNSN